MLANLVKDIVRIVVFIVCFVIGWSIGGIFSESSLIAQRQEKLELMIQDLKAEIVKLKEKK